MSRRVVTAPSAAEDLRRARRWLLQPGSGADARLRWAALRDARHRLRDHPYLGKPDVDHPDYRVLGVSGHRIVYRLVPDTGDAETTGDVQILRVFGPGQMS